MVREPQIAFMTLILLILIVLAALEVSNSGLTFLAHLLTRWWIG